MTRPGALFDIPAAAPPVQVVQHEDVLVFRKPEVSDDAAKSTKRRKARKPADELQGT